MRFPVSGVAADGAGNVILSGTIAAILYGTSTAATVYEAQSGGASVTSITSDSANGTYELWIDDGDYEQIQVFTLQISKDGGIGGGTNILTSYPFTLAGLAFKAVTETLTNKTIDTANNTITVVEADISDHGTLAAMVADNLSVFAATTSLQLLGVISDETGSGSLVFGTSPTIVTPTIVTPTIASLVNVPHTHFDAANGGGLGNPAFSVHKNGSDQTAVVTNVWTQLTWPTEVFDTTGAFASNEFIPLVAGKYMLIAAANILIINNAKDFEIAIYKNGSAEKIVVGNSSNASTDDVSVYISALVEANGTDDDFRVYVRHQHGADLIIDGPATLTYFQGFKIAE